MLTFLHASCAIAPAALRQVGPALAAPALACRVRRCAVLQREGGEEDQEAAREQERAPSDLAEEYNAGLEYGLGIRARFASPRIDDPGLPYADALVCVGGALFIAQWALNPAVPLGLKIPLPGWLSPMAMPAGLDWRGLPYVLPALSHGAGLALCWTLGALAASAYESEAYMGTWQTALGRTWRAGAFAVGVLIFSTQASLFVSLSSQGLDPYTVPTTEGIDSLERADTQILQTAFELIIDVIVQATSLTLFRLFRWTDGQSYK